MNNLFFLFSFLLMMNLSAQSETKSEGVLEVHFVPGIFFLGKSKNLPINISNVNRNLGFNVSFGPNRFGIKPSAGWNRLAPELETELNGVIGADSTFVNVKRTQFSFGLIAPWKVGDAMVLNLKGNLTVNSLNKPLSRFPVGQKYSIGLGYLPQNGFFSMFLDFGYDYSGRFQEPYYSTFSGTFVNFGIGLSLVPKEKEI